MLMSIKNFGPIDEGRIDLSKKFYLFVGHNNSGKTYVAQLLWGIFHPSTRRKFFDSLKKNGNSYIKADSDSSYHITDESIRNLLKDYSDFIVNETIPEIFNLEKDHFLTENFSLEFLPDNDSEQIRKKRIVNKSIVSVVMDEVSQKEFEIFEAVKEEDSLTVEIKKKDLDKVFFDYVPKIRFYKDFKEEREAEIAVSKILLQGMLPEEKPFYLPASRLFYPIFYEYIFRYEKDRREEISNHILKALSSKETLDPETAYLYKSRYTIPMNVLMNKIYDLNEEKSDDISGHYEEFCEKIEEIIGGRIQFKRREGLAPAEFYLELGKNKNLEMYLSSSSVNQLTSLYIFFKHWAEDGSNFLIIDEPEENLHPGNQVKLLNLLAEFANQKDNRVLLTTHSTLLSQAMNNHFYLGILKERGVDINRLIEKEGLDISPETCLRNEELGVYFFDGKHIHSYEAGEYGILFNDFRREEIKIQNIAEILTDEIYYQDSSE